MEWWQMWHLS